MSNNALPFYFTLCSVSVFSSLLMTRLSAGAAAIVVVVVVMVVDIICYENKKRGTVEKYQGSFYAFAHSSYICVPIFLDRSVVCLCFGPMIVSIIVGK
jgi:hypothetical protein